MLYAIVLAVTFAVHIPLNNDIDQADPDRITDLAHIRDDFEDPWVLWNIVRTLLTTAAVAALARALLLHGRSTAHRTAPANTAEPAWAPPATTLPAARPPPPRATDNEEHPRCNAR